MFGAPLETGPTKPLREVDVAVGRIREIMSLPPSDGPRERTFSLGGATVSAAIEVSPRVASAAPSSSLRRARDRRPGELGTITPESS
jgi:hypothetical protein